MKKTYTLLLSILLLLTLVTEGCKKKSAAPVSERIAKSWTAESVKENQVVVYTRGGASNTRDYSNFKLVLTSAGVATYTEFDKNIFTGTWALNGDTKLVLSGLNPQPSGSGGTVTFTISSLDDNKVVLTNVSPSPKTGNTTNEYTLSN